MQRAPSATARPPIATEKKPLLIVRQAQSRAMLCFNCLVKGRITSASSRVQDDPGFHDRFAIGELPALTEDPHPAGHTQLESPPA
jgi:hypothetical protein